MNGKLCLVVLSGGQDSTTCLAMSVDEYGRENVEAITFDYGQRHLLEVEQCRSITEIFQVRHNVIKTDLLKQFDDSALVNREKNISDEKDGLPSSFVPGRNNFLLLMAAIFAYKKNIKNIVAGVCQTDYSGYPDCRQRSIDAVETAINLCMETDFVIHTPLMNLTKAQTFALAESLGFLDVVIEHTITCYEGATIKNPWGLGCGQCPACKLREKGFNEYRRQKA